MNFYGLTKAEFIEGLKECGMATKTWTLSKRKDFKKYCKETIENRRKK